eukprot:6328541-Prymnesium_polylepis.1
MGSQLSNRATTRPRGCYLEYPLVNLVLPARFNFRRCKLRYMYKTRQEAEEACDAETWCEGVTMDAGIRCHRGKLLFFEIRAGEDTAKHNGVVSWKRSPPPAHAPTTHDWCASLQRHHKKHHLNAMT